MNSEKKKLAIFTPQIGSCSETFIQRHIQDLLPGRTVIVTGTIEKPHAEDWVEDYPNLVLEQFRPTFPQRIYRVIRQKLGMPVQRELSHLAVANFLKKHHVQVCLGEYLDHALPFFELTQKLGIPFFGHAHGYDVSARLRQAEWRQAYLRYNASAGIITINQRSRQRLTELGLEASKIHLIPYGVDVPEQPLLREEHESVRCLAVGRMVAKKAPILLLEAFRQALKHFPKLHLDYIGSGELLPAVQQFIHAFQLTDKITLHGSRPHPVVLEFLHNTDIFLQHSITDPVSGDQEGLPVAILEAMAHSLPVISTRHTGIPDAVLHNVTGYLVEEGELCGMAEGLVTLARDFQLRRRMGYDGWQRVNTTFSWERERQALLKILGINGKLDIEG